jgi:hypothetical protein
LPNIVLVIKIKNLNGQASYMYGERRGAYRILMERPDGKR